MGQWEDGGEVGCEGTLEEKVKSCIPPFSGPGGCHVGGGSGGKEMKIPPPHGCKDSGWSAIVGEF